MMTHFVLGMALVEIKMILNLGFRKKKISDSLISINYKNAANEELKILENLQISLKKKKLTHESIILYFMNSLY